MGAQELPPGVSHPHHCDTRLPLAFYIPGVDLASALLLSSASPVLADEIVWQLRLQDGHPLNCTLAETKVAKDAKGQPVFEADSSASKADWNSCVILPAGLLKAGQD